MSFAQLGDLSGPYAIYAKPIVNSEKLAVDNINSSHFLGSTKLTLDFKDTEGSPATAETVANEVAGKYAVVLGPTTSTETEAALPVYVRTKQPNVDIQAGGIDITADNVFRLTTLQTALLPNTLKYLQTALAAGGNKSIATIYDSDNASLMALAKQVSSNASQYGLTFAGSSTTQSTATNVASEVSKVLSFHPGAIAVFLAGAQNSTTASLLVQAHYSGKVIASSAAGVGFSGAEPAANGWTWTTDWNAPGTGATSTAYAKAYEAKYGSLPNNYGAEAYDSIYFAATAIKNAKSTQPAAVTAALIALGKTGFDGVLGHFTVTNGQEVSQGTLVKWENGKIIPAS